MDLWRGICIGGSVVAFMFFLLQEEWLTATWVIIAAFWMLMAWRAQDEN